MRALSPKRGPLCLTGSTSLLRSDARGGWPRRRWTGVFSEPIRIQNGNPGFMRPSQIRNLILLAVLLALILGSMSTIANFIIEYNWWKEVGQVETWISMLWYSIAPAAAGALVAFIALWVAHARGLHFAGVRRRDFRLYSLLVPVGLAIVAILFASASIDYWTIMRFFGSRGVTLPPATWKDPVFSRALPFYLFDLPFYSEVLGFVFVLAILCALVFWVTARGWQSAERFHRGRLRGGSPETFDLGPHALLLPGATRAGFVRVIAVILLLGLATWVFLGNYELLLNSHAFMTGADYVGEKVTLPLRWLLIIAALAALPLLWTSRYKKAIALLIAVFILQLVLPRIVRAVYVRPNEISIERPYIERHIQATTVAFGLNRSATERPFTASGQETVDAVQDATLLDNVRLWDLRAYNATITQIQALRPYYTFPDPDVDRYFINGRIKQVLLSPRDIDVSQLSAEARRAGSIRDSFIRMALAWSYRRSIRLHPTACRSCSSKTPRPKSSLLGSGSHGQRSTTARALRIRCLCTPPARSSIILPATRTSIRHTRAREGFPLALFW